MTLVVKEPNNEVEVRSRKLVVIQERTKTVIVYQGPPGPKGDPGPPGGEAGFTYVHTQGIPSVEWTINHNLSGFPNITVVDSANTAVLGEIEYVNNMTVILRFTAPFSGRAFLS